MREFEINLFNVRDVQEFVNLATNQPFEVLVKDSRRQVNGKSFMEMFCLNFRRPVTVVLNCTEEELCIFQRVIRRFLVD